MGNKTSCTVAVHANPPRRSKITNEHDSIILTGTVFLSVDQAKGLSSVKCISIQFNGQEETVVPSNTYSGYASNKMVTQSVPFVSVEVPIHVLLSKQRGHIQNGQYEFPFEWVLPSNLPSSMICHPSLSSNKDENHVRSAWKNLTTKNIHPSSRCRVQYTLTAILHFESQANTITNRLTSMVGLPQRQDKSPLISQPHIIYLSSGTPPSPLDVSTSSLRSQGPVHSAAAVPPTTIHEIGRPISTPTIIEQIQKLYCRPQGSISISSTLDSGIMTIPQQGSYNGIHHEYGLIVTLQNNSSSLIHGVQFKLREQVKWCAAQVVLPEQHQGDDQVWDSISHTLCKSPLTLIEENHGNHTQIWKGVVILPAGVIRDSYYGTIIQVRHWVQIKVLTPWHTTSRLKSKIDVTLTRQENNNDVTSSTNANVPLPTPSAPMKETYSSHSSHNQSAQDVGGRGKGRKNDAKASTGSHAIPIANTLQETQALPPDWNPITAEVITIPMENVTVLPN